MTLILTNADVEQLVTMADCVDIIEDAFRSLGRGEASGRPRSLNYSPLRPGEPDDYYAFTTCDAALPSRGVHILRLTSDRMAIRRTNGREKRTKLAAGPGGTYCGLIMLFSTETLEPLAIFQDALLNRMMVGATSAIAARALTNPNPRRMALIGAGWLAPTQALGHCAVLPLERIDVYSPTREHSERLCAEVGPMVDAELVAVDDVRAAVEGADLVAIATNSTKPVFDGDWLRPGQHVGSVQVMELDDRTHDRASVIVARAADAISYWHPETFRPAEVDQFQRWQPAWDAKLRLLGKILVGAQTGRVSPDDITLFGGSGTGPSAGVGIQWSPANVAHERAREQGMGVEVPSELFLEAFHP
jgi:ornithine cyclodeaminase/alanine dehydrogenase-like protein (mu-crystallin family)